MLSNETDRLYALLVWALIMLAFYIPLKRFEKRAEKDGTTIQCKTCANRRGDYRPKSCKNCACKFYRN